MVRHMIQYKDDYSDNVFLNFDYDYKFIHNFVGQGMYERSYYCINIAHIAVILWGYVLI